MRAIATQMRQTKKISTDNITKQDERNEYTLHLQN